MIGVFAVIGCLTFGMLAFRTARWFWKITQLEADALARPSLGDVVMGITYGDHLIDSGYYDITPEQEHEIEGRKGTEMTELLLCPFCGGKPLQNGPDNPGHEYWISCQSCQASSLMRSNVEAAQSAWNARTPVSGAKEP